MRLSAAAVSTGVAARRLTGLALAPLAAAFSCHGTALNATPVLCRGSAAIMASASPVTKGTHRTVALLFTSDVHFSVPVDKQD